MTKFEKHLSYVGPKLVPLSLFSSSLSMHMKCNIVYRMHQTYDPEVQWNVRGLKGDKSRDLSTAELSDLVNCPPFSWCWHWLHLVIISTHMEYISCVSAGSVNCLFTDCDQWCSWTFNCPDVTVQPVNYKEWSGDADTTSGCCRHRRRLPVTRKSTLKATGVNLTS